MNWEDPNSSTPRRYSPPNSLNQGQRRDARTELGLAGVVIRKSNSEDATVTIQDDVRIFEKHNRKSDNEGPLHDITCRSRSPSSPCGNRQQTSREILLEENPMVQKILGCPTAARHFFTATTVPPITKASLNELDISSIVNNPKLRHDVNFDRELHFRPNLDGRRGFAKREAQKGYWQAITAELQLYRHIYDPSVSMALENGVRKDCQQRIPHMFTTIKEILKHLVPDRDQSSVDEHLDVPMIMQEIENGVCDFAKIAMWLAHLLKRHCAPMRDEMVGRMVDKIRHGDAASISAGLCDLFGVLEAMKLDVANHQIRHLRALLIDDTINFEQKNHLSCMKRNLYNVYYARDWFLHGKETLNRVPLTSSWPNRNVEAFVNALLRSLMPTSSVSFPYTFKLDEDRLRVLKADLQDLVFENICCNILKDLVVVRSEKGYATEDAQIKLRKALQVIIDDGRCRNVSVGHVSVELARHALRLSGSNLEYDGELAELAEQCLQQALSDPATQQQYAENLMADISGELLHHVEKCLTISPWDIFNSLVPPTPQSQIASTRFMAPAAKTHTSRRRDIIYRITHIGALNWRIWQHAVYNNPEIGRTPSPRSSPSNTPGSGSTSPSPISTIQNRAPIASLDVTSISPSPAAKEIDQENCSSATMPTSS